MAKKRAWNNTNPLYRYLQNKKVGTRKKTTMARRRKTSRRFGSRRSSGSSKSPVQALINGAIYGAAIGPVYGFVSSFAAKLPFGAYNEKVAKAGLAYAAATYGSGMIKDAGYAGLNAEGASVGAQATAGMFSSSSSTSSSQNTTFY